MMRLVLKLLAAPFALAFSIAAALFSFVLSVSDRIFSVVSGLVFFAAVLLLIVGQTTGGIAFMAVAFAVSPFGVPALAGLLVKGLDGAGGALRSFIFS
jgi:hypothetical protein